MDTIAAISTPIGNGGIGIIRISGKESISISKKIFKTQKSEYMPNTIVYGKIVYDNEFIDEALVSYFKAPNSYTGEDIIEINSHGGMVVLQRILDIVLACGARLAEPGEFTKRAFLNGKIDLAQAESVMDMINSKSKEESKISAKVLNGDLGSKIRNIKKQVLDVLIDLEANVDYPEYDIEEISRNKVISAISNSLDELNKLSKSFYEGKIVKNGINVVIVGKPNVGKSSLLNRLLSEERAIVTDVAGTTRDTIEESIIYNGVVLNLIDTAGIHDTEDKVEKIGVEKSKKSLENADVVLFLIDNSRELDDEDKMLFDLIKNKKTLLLVNKTDINDQLNNDFLNNMDKKEIFLISAKENIGIQSVLDRILEDFKVNNISNHNGIVISNQRHKEAIDSTINSFNNVIKACNEQIPLDMISIDIQNGLNYLSEILGENVSEDIINGIFKKFCLGK